MKKVLLIGCLVLLTGMLNQAYADTIYFTEDEDTLNSTDKSNLPKRVEPFCTGNELRFVDSNKKSDVLVSVKTDKCEEVAQTLRDGVGQSILIVNSGFPFSSKKVFFLKKKANSKAIGIGSFTLDNAKESVSLSSYVSREESPKTATAGAKRATAAPAAKASSGGSEFRESGAYNDGMKVLQGGEAKPQ